MDVIDRLIGIFHNPKLIMKEISKRPEWIDALVILLIAVALFNYFTAPHLQKDTVQLLQRSTKLQERVGEEGINAMIERTANPSRISVILSNFLAKPGASVVGFLLSSLIIFGMSRIFSIEGSYKQVFSAILHANFIDKILGNALRLALIFIRKSFMQTTTSLALFFPKLEVTSTAFIILSQVDFFQLWLFGVLSYGLAIIFKIELKKALILSYGFWVLKSLFNIGISLISMRFLA
jgi:hypothetical protein